MESYQVIYLAASQLLCTSALLQRGLELAMHGTQDLEGLQLAHPGLQDARHRHCALRRGTAECSTLAENHLQCTTATPVSVQTLTVIP